MPHFCGPKSLDLARIPNHLLLSVFKKCHPVEFVRFHRTNKRVSEVALSKSHYIRLKVKELTLGGCFDHDAHAIYVANEYCAHPRVLEAVDRRPFYLEAHQVTVEAGRLPTAVRERFLNTISKFKVQTDALVISSKVTAEELSGYIEKIRTKSIIVCSSSFCGDHLQALSCGKILALEGLQITSQDINLFIKQWCEDKRQIELFNIVGTDGFVANEIIDCLPVKLISGGNGAINRPWSRFDTVYALSKANCNKRLIIQISTASVEIEINSDT